MYHFGVEMLLQKVKSHPLFGPLLVLTTFNMQCYVLFSFTGRLEEHPGHIYKPQNEFPTN
jgi:hypothetical protein